MTALGAERGWIGMETKVFHVPGMTCGHCRMAITQAVKGLPGVAGVDVDLASKRVTVTFDGGRVGEEAIRAAIEDAGYEVA